MGWTRKIPSPWDFPGSSVVKTQASTERGLGLIPGWGTKSPHTQWCGKKKLFLFKKEKKIPSPFLLLKTHGVYFSISKGHQVD